MSAQTDFIASIVPGAQQTQAKYRILASLVIAQAILESGWGKYAIANNLFGIKANGTSGPTISVPTKEFVNGQYVSVTATFRAYQTPSDSIADHGQFLATNSRYHNIIGVTDAKTACQLIQQDGYATDPQYSAKLLELIIENSLTKYDAAPAPQKAAPAPAPQHIETIRNGNYYIHSAIGTATGIVGLAKNGQAFATSIVSGDWRKITINGRAAYIGPAAFR